MDTDSIKQCISLLTNGKSVPKARIAHARVLLCHFRWHSMMAENSGNTKAVRMIDNLLVVACHYLADTKLSAHDAIERAVAVCDIAGRIADDSIKEKADAHAMSTAKDLIDDIFGIHRTTKE